MASYANIPGVITSVSDGNLRSGLDPSTPKVTLLGCTTNTTVKMNDPIRVIGSVTLSDFDLSTGKPSELSRAIQECQDAGCDNIEVMVISRLAGDNDAGTLTDNGRFAALETAYSLLLDHPVDIVVPVGAYIDEPLSSSNSFGYQLANFCYQSTKNFDSCLGVIGTTRPVTGTTSGGLSTISLSDQSTYVDALTDFSTASILGTSFTSFNGVTDANTDGIPDSYGYYATTDEVLPTGSTPSTASTVVKDSNNNPVDIGAYINVVAGLYRFKNNIASRQLPADDAYDGDGAAAYAGLIAGLPPHDSPTNKSINGPTLIRNYSLTQANSLAGKRYVVFREKAGVTKVLNGMTGAYNISTTYRSDFVRLTTIRILHDAADRVRAVADPFIGRANNGPNIQAFRAEIDQTLGRLQTLGALRRYQFNIIATPAMQVLGQATVNLTLVPAFEITEITVNIALAKE